MLLIFPWNQAFGGRTPIKTPVALQVSGFFINTVGGRNVLSPCLAPSSNSVYVLVLQRTGVLLKLPRGRQPPSHQPNDAISTFFFFTLSRKDAPVFRDPQPISGLFWLVQKRKLSVLTLLLVGSKGIIGTTKAEPHWEENTQTVPHFQTHQ